ncbi:hypothetical protein [Adonisia turfae]|uniref:Uncharacterized protein n=1 Tax=Adonisia turfae CCMR0081 TaxID=2292702 RepID=A0A6M0RGU3_9CYAN|nr:hypothetical protein [Adonisia turfae]NEZ55474.1 hypothetical protein [Adonisia turfae CCMR0081]
MPILGLTTKADTPIETSQLGKAWKGKKKTQNRAGEDLKDKFRLEIPAPYDKVILAKYGTMLPTELRVFFPHEETEKVFETWNDAVTVQGLQHRCNGERITKEVVTKTGYRAGKPYPKRHRQDCDRPCLKGPDEVICKQCVSTGYLKFYIRELFGVTGMQQVIVQTVTGINDVVGVTKQLRAFEEKYGSLSKSSIPSPYTWNYVPFILRRVPKDISRPLYDSKAKAYKGGYGRGTAYPIVITEDPEWLEFWQNHMRRQMILQMVENGQAGLLQESDRKILQDMQSLELPMATVSGQLPVAEVEQKAIAPSTSNDPILQEMEVLEQKAIAAEPVVDTFEAADQDAAEAYREEMLSRTPNTRAGEVNRVLKFDADFLKDLWQQTDQSSGDDVQITSDYIELMLLAYAEQHMVQQRDATKLMVRLQDELGLVDEGLAEMFVSELPNHVRPAAKEQPETFNNVSID